MSLHLYTKSWDAPLERNTKSVDGAVWEKGRDLLADPGACGEAITRYEGAPIPAFARERPDIAGIEERLPLGEGKKHIVVIGNGGSIRNVWALYHALIQGGDRGLHLLDGTDPSGLLGELMSGNTGFTPANTLVVPVSKSGNTENVVQETALLLTKDYPMLAVVSPGESKLAALIDEKGLERFPHPAEVGGRYTAGQNNALLPLALAKGDIETARKLDTAFEAAHVRLGPSVPVEENMAKAMALRFWEAELAGYTELFLPIYAKALSGLGELVVQLVHESYCKAGKGQTVLFAEAPESQHHTNQRYFGGRGDMAGLTIRVNSFGSDFPLKGGISAGDFLDLEHAGVVAEAERTGAPHMVLTLDEIGSEEVASAVALWQWAAVYGGLLRGVNPFDQPAVEGSKNATIEMFEQFGPKTREDLSRFTKDASVSL